MSPDPADLCTITPYRDGPLLVRGPVRLQDMTATRSRSSARPLPSAAAASRASARSATAPTSSSRFRAPSGAEDASARPSTARPDRNGRAASERPASQLPSRWPAQSAVERGQRARAPDDVRGQLRLLAGKAAREVDGGDVLVHGVGDDVLVEEGGRVARRSRDAAGRSRSGGSVSRRSSRTAPGGRRSRPRSRRCSPQSDIRFTVAKRHAGNAIEVGAVGVGSRPRASIASANSCRVDPLRAARRRTRRPGSRPSPPWDRRAGAGAPRCADRPP